MPEKDRTLSLLPEVPDPKRRRRWTAAELSSQQYPVHQSVILHLRTLGARGATDEEMGAALGMPDGTARGRLCELVYQCDPPLALVASGTKRAGRQVYLATPEAR